MKKLLIVLLLLWASVTSSLSQVHVRGYYRKNGTYVQPHQRTYPNHTITDNYNYPGNYNPNTGRITGGSSPTHNATNFTPSTTGTSYNAPIINTNPSRSADSFGSSLTNPRSPITSSRPESQMVMYAVVESNAALKAQPNYMADSKYAIPKGSIVRVKQYNESYYLAEVDGRNGYVCTCQVKRTYSESN